VELAVDRWLRFKGKENMEKHINAFGKMKSLLEMIQKALTIPASVGVIFKDDMYQFYASFEHVPFLHSVPSVFAPFDKDQLEADEDMVVQQIVGAMTGFLEANLPMAMPEVGDGVTTFATEIICPKCQWVGTVGTLKVKEIPKQDNVGAYCPKCDHTDAFGDHFIEFTDGIVIANK
jgi:hypothetical protein